MKHLSPTLQPCFFDFFVKLAANNNRDWFQAHKNMFQRQVFEPFKSLTEAVIERMQGIHPDIYIKYKEAAFRIYRDTRFSKDKTPYKLWMGAVVNPVGRKNTRYPELYFQFGPGENFIAVGLYRPDKEILTRIRNDMALRPENFALINENPDFRNFFSEGFQGQRNKRLPQQTWTKAAVKNPFILNKQFVAIRYYSPEEILRPDLVDFIVAHYRAAQPFNEWLYDLI